MNPQPYTVHVPQLVLDDLKDRLTRTRWPDEIRDTGWEQGAPLSYLQSLCSQWQDQFDWRLQEARLSAFNHFRADIDGIGIHFIHHRAKHPGAVPLLLTHGFPDSFLRFQKIIPMLCEPEGFGGRAEDAFHVVVPSMPGFGFSDRPSVRGLASPHFIADLWAQLMGGLGYERFAAHGGDLGSDVTHQLTQRHPQRLLGAHLTDLPWRCLDSIAPEQLTEAERRYRDAVRQWQQRDGAFGLMQRTRPQTLGYGLNDSPSGLAAWFVEEFRAWSDGDGEAETRFTRDELLTHLTLCWATQTLTSSFRASHDVAHAALPALPAQREVPTAFALFPNDLPHPPREHAERFCRVSRWTEMPRGGHFAAWEEPKLLAADLAEFFRPLRH